MKKSFIITAAVLALSVGILAFVLAAVSGASDDITCSVNIIEGDSSFAEGIGIHLTAVSSGYLYWDILCTLEDGCTVQAEFSYVNENSVYQSSYEENIPDNIFYEITEMNENRLTAAIVDQNSGDEYTAGCELNAGEEPVLCGEYYIENGCVFETTAGFAVISKDDISGEYTAEFFSLPDMGVLTEGSVSCCAFLYKEGRLVYAYSETDSSGSTDAGFKLAVFGGTDLLYLGEYACSLDDIPAYNAEGSRAYNSILSIAADN